jgi:hypothetical protein
MLAAITGFAAQRYCSTCRMLTARGVDWAMFDVGPVGHVGWHLSRN